MSNNKQSSVDYFWNQLPEILPFTVGTETAVKLWGAFEQAKAMEKKQTVDFALNYAFGNNPIDRELRDNCEKLYNETFNNEQTN